MQTNENETFNLPLTLELTEPGPRVDLTSLATESNRGGGKQSNTECYNFGILNIDDVVGDVTLDL